MTLKKFDYLNVIILIYLTWANINPIKPILLTISIISIYMILGLIALKKITVTKEIVNRKLIICFNLLILFSNFYSSNKQLTLINSTIFTGITLYSFLLCALYDEEGFLRMLNKYFIISIIASLFLILFIPNKGTMLDERLFVAAIGIYGHKNILGRYMVIGFFILIYQASRYKNKLYKRINYIFATQAIYLIICSKSSTSLIYLIVLSILYYIIKNKNQLINSVVNITFMGGIIFSIFTLLSAQPKLYKIFSNISIGEKNLGLTGRNIIWTFSIEKIKSNPILGYGFDAVWNNENITMQFYNKYKFFIPHAHNGYLDITLQLGLIGLLFMIIILYKILKYRKNDSNILATILGIFLIFINFTEAAFIEDTTYIFWILIIYFYKQFYKKDLEFEKLNDLRRV